MSRTMTSKCDGCGVEHVDDGNTLGIPSILSAGRRRGTDHWGNLSFSTGSFPATFDLCDGCVKRVVALLELEVPDPRAIAQKLGLSGLGGHAMYMPGDDFMTPPSAPPWVPSKPLADTPFGALTPEDLKALGIELPPSVTPADAVGPYTCPGCQTLRVGPIPGFACPTCQHQD